VLFELPWVFSDVAVMGDGATVAVETSTFRTGRLALEVAGEEEEPMSLLDCCNSIVLHCKNYYLSLLDYYSAYLKLN
jgi:hypothetical protein